MLQFDTLTRYLCGQIRNNFITKLEKYNENKEQREYALHG